MTPGRIHVIMPLEAGNAWDYADTISRPLSLAFSSSLTVTGDTVITWETSDHGVSTVEHYDSYTGIASVYFMSNGESGLWEYGIACDEDDRFYGQIKAPYPADPADEWYMGYYYCDNSGYTTWFPVGPAVCISTDSTITTLAGTFDCHVYRSVHETGILGTLNMYTFYAPDVGLILKEISGEAFHWKTSLVDFDIK